jgi:protein transport protein SEC61 subunit gamma-like protein
MADEQQQLEGQPEEQPVQEAADEPKNSQGSRLNNHWQKLKKFARECQRVLKVLKKPDKQEFLTTAKVSAIGLTIIGLIGFALSMVQQAII